MKIVNIKISVVAILAFALTLGCNKKGNTGPEGPQGAQGPQGPLINLVSNGFISGTVVGMHRDGTPMNETFNFQKYAGDNNQPAGILDSLSPTYYSYQISRYNDVFSSNGAYLSLITTSKSASTGTMNLNVTIEKTLTNNKLFKLTVYTSTATTSSIVYNSSTGIVTGNFSVFVSGSSNNTGYPLTVNGSFQSNITQLYYIKKKLSEIKTE